MDLFVINKRYDGKFERCKIQNDENSELFYLTIEKNFVKNVKVYQEFRSNLHSDSLFQNQEETGLES